MTAAVRFSWKPVSGRSAGVLPEGHSPDFCFLMQCSMNGRYNLPEGAIVVVSALGGPEDPSAAAAADAADAADSAALAAELADAAATEVAADAVRSASYFAINAFNASAANCHLGK